MPIKHRLRLSEGGRGVVNERERERVSVSDRDEIQDHGQLSVYPN